MKSYLKATEPVKLSGAIQLNVIDFLTFGFVCVIPLYYLKKIIRSLFDKLNVIVVMIANYIMVFAVQNLTVGIRR